MSIIVWDNHSDILFSEALKNSSIEFSEVSSADDLAVKLPSAELVIINQDLLMRRQVLRELISSKTPFAIYGIPGPDAAARKELSKRLKKRHMNACWLGSLRFLPGIFSLKEFLNSGAMGKVSNILLQGWENNPSGWNAFRESDLIEWLAEATGAECEKSIISTAQKSYRIQLKSANGILQWQYTPGHNAVLDWQIEDRKKHKEFVEREALVLELQLLAYCVAHQYSWYNLASL
ncbi:MAG: hypothetical protein WCS73_11145 [Lentisphaeria bacterium]